MLEFFRMAEATRLPELKNIPLTELMKSAAEEAGWHLEYVENLQNQNKYQVRYEKPFSSVVVAELAGRMRPAIMKFLLTVDQDPGTIDSYIGYGFFNFIKTYKPDVHNTDEKIKQALFRSIQNKVCQLSRKELFKYRPGYTGTKNRAGEDVRNCRFKNTPREISYNRPAFNDGDSEAELGDFIPDYRPSPMDLYLDQEDSNEVYGEYGASEEVEKLCIEILLEAGNHDKISLKDLKRDVAIRLIPKIEIKVTYKKIEILEDRQARINGEKRKKENKENQEIQKALDEEYKSIQDEIDKLEESINSDVSSLNRQVKTFYRKLKAKLAEKYHI